MEHCLGPVSKRILPNHRRSDISVQAKAKNIIENCLFLNIQMCFHHICKVNLGSTSSTSHVGMVRNVKSKHDLDTFFESFERFSYNVQWDSSI